MKSHGFQVGYPYIEGTSRHTTPTARFPGEYLGKLGSKYYRSTGMRTCSARHNIARSEYNASSLTCFRLVHRYNKQAFLRGISEKPNRRF